MVDDDSTRTATADPFPAKLKLRSHAICVEVVKGPDAGTSINLPGFEARIGKGKNCELVLKDETVSRLHLTLQVKGNAIRVLDNESRNGTWIDGVRIRDADARPDSLIIIGGTTLRLRMLRQVVELPLSARDRFGDLLGISVAMRRVFTLLEKIAETDSPALIEGETGTGKELAARGIHTASRRKDNPYVVFDCGAVVDTLIDDELFGHRKGAFSGADRDRAGRFEEANGGTIFLDEIGELPLHLQPKLLRVLDLGEVRRLGDDGPRKVNVRVVAATNRSLLREVDRGRFRADLYYRLVGLRVIRMPPLRERAEDIPLLVRHFAEQLKDELPAPVSLSDALIREFQALSWPGNLRELQSAVQQALWITDSEPSSSSWPEERTASIVQMAQKDVDSQQALLSRRDEVANIYEKAYAERLLELSRWNVTQAARRAGVGRVFLQKIIAKYGLARPGDRGQ